jgi:hypothetical protein
MTQSLADPAYSELTSVIFSMEKYIPFPCKFNNDLCLLTITANNVAIDISYDTIFAHYTANFEAKSQNLLQVESYIAFSIFLQIINKAYQETYSDFENISFQTFDQSIYNLMLDYFTLLQCIDKNDTFIDSQSDVNTDLLIEINSELKDSASTFYDYKSEVSKKSKKYFDHFIQITEILRNVSAGNDSSSTERLNTAKFSPPNFSYFQHENCLTVKKTVHWEAQLPSPRA